MRKTIFIILVVLVVLLLTSFCFFFVGKPEPAEEMVYGVSFSKPFAERLGLDWKEVYFAILDELKVKKLRLPAYWTEIESIEGQYDFSDLDWQIDEAEKRGIGIILIVGRKLPRWPECHIPDWAEGLNEKEQQKRVLDLIEEVVERYKERESIKAWQMENEPFLRHFGICPKLDKKFLEKEIALVRSLNNRPIIITASGEFDTWIGAYRRADVMGTTLYRIVWVKWLRSHLRYPLPPIFYHRKTALMKWLFGPKKIIVIELQAEPWGPDLSYKLSLEEQYKSMNLEQFKENVEYARQAGFSEIYLWGAEWWYWIKEKHRDGSIWEEAKELFKG